MPPTDGERSIIDTLIESNRLQRETNDLLTQQNQLLSNAIGSIKAFSKMMCNHFSEITGNQEGVV